MKKHKLIQLLSPYGNLPHAKGMQCVDKKAGENLLKNFPSYLAQKFFKKVPIYVGHPDECQKKSALKKQIVGYVESIILIEEGIAALCTYDNIHYEKIIKKELRSMSPRWRTQECDDGTYIPVELISVGLTNEPNIERAGEILRPKNHLQELKLSTELERSIYNSKTCIESVSKIKSIQNTLKENISKKLLSSALNKGAISTQDCHKWANDFKEKFTETKKKLIQASSKSEGLSARELISLTRQKMQEKSISWDLAFAQVKKEKSITQTQIA